MVVLKELILIVSTLEGCGVPEKNSFCTVCTLAGCDGPEQTIIFNSFYCGRVV